MIKYKYLTVLIVGMCIVCIMFVYGIGSGINVATDSGNENNIDSVNVEVGLQDKTIDVDKIYIYDITDHDIGRTYEEIDEVLRAAFRDNEYVSVIDSEKQDVGNGYYSELPGDETQLNGIYLRSIEDGFINIYLATYTQRKLMYGGAKMEQFDADRIGEYVDIVRKIVPNISNNCHIQEFYDTKINSSDSNLYYWYRAKLYRSIDGIDTTDGKLKRAERTKGESIQIDFNNEKIIGIQVDGFSNIQKGKEISVSKNVIAEAIDNFKMWVYANDDKNTYVEYFVKDATLKYCMREPYGGNEYYDPIIELTVDVTESKYTDTCIFSYSISEQEIIDFELYRYAGLYVDMVIE